MITCGLCGSGVTAEEKLKQQKNGNKHHYVYYVCTKFNDKHCPCGYIREEELIEQLAGILDTIALDEIGMKEKIRAEIEAHNAFQQSVLGLKADKIKVKEIDIRNYAKHILRNRPIEEKRTLLDNLRSKLILREKTILLQQ